MTVGRGGDACTPSCLHSLVCGLTQLFFQSGPVVTISGGPIGGALLSPTPRGSLHLPGSFAVRPEGLWGPKGKARNRWPQLGAPGPPNKGGPTLVFSVSPSFSGLCRGLLCASHFCPSICPWAEAGSVCE